jgi:drug/metabolite transporter (DMT)-like permease
MNKGEASATAIFVIVAWSSSYALIKVGLREVLPLSFAAYRFLITVAFMLLLTPLVKNRLNLRNLNSLDGLRLVLLGLTGVTFYHSFIFIGLVYTTAVNAAILVNIAPIFIAILSAIFLKERIGREDVLGITIAFVGTVGVITNFRMETLQSMGAVGDLLVIGSVASWAVYTVVGKSMMEKYDSLAITFYAIIIGTPFLLVLAQLHEGVSFAVRMSPNFLAILLFLAIVCTAIGYILWYEVVKVLGASKTGFFLFLMPLFSIAFAYLLLGETLTVWTGMGAVLILLGVYLTQKGGV